MPDCTDSAGSPQLFDAAGNEVLETPTMSGRGISWIDLPDGTYTLDLTLPAEGLVLCDVDGDALPTVDPLILTIPVEGGQDYGVGVCFAAP